MSHRVNVVDVAILALHLAHAALAELLQQQPKPRGLTRCTCSKEDRAMDLPCAFCEWHRYIEDAECEAYGIEHTAFRLESFFAGMSDSLLKCCARLDSDEHYAAPDVDQLAAILLQLADGHTPVCFPAGQGDVHLPFGSCPPVPPCIISCDASPTLRL